MFALLANPLNQYFEPKYAIGYATSEEIRIKYTTFLDKSLNTTSTEAP